MKKKLKIGIIGAGLNTRVKHIPGFQAIDGVQVVAVSNRSKEQFQWEAMEPTLEKCRRQLEVNQKTTIRQR